MNSSKSKTITISIQYSNDDLYIPMAIQEINLLFKNSSKRNIQVQMASLKNSTKCLSKN
jgi:hypothetical protein